MKERALDLTEASDRRRDDRGQAGAGEGRSVLRSESRDACYPDVVAAFGEVANAISEGVALDPLLHVVAERICSLLSIARCSVYLRDTNTAVFRGQVAHSDRDIDVLIKRLIAGTEADGFTREIVDTRRPVLIANAQADPRPVRAAMVRWNVRSMLGVPMVLQGKVIGVLFLDNEEIPHDFTSTEQELSLSFASLAAIAISQAKLTSELRATLNTAAQQNAALRRAAAIEDRLTDLVLEGANLGEIAAAVTEMTGKPCSIHDSAYRLLASAPDDGSAAVNRVFDSSWLRDPSIREALQGLTARRPSVLGPTPSAGLNQRFLVASVKVGRDDWGYLVLVEAGSRIGAKDMIVARRTATIIALEMSGRRQAAEAESHAREALTRDLLHGSDDPGSLTRRADYHGLALGEPHLAVLLSSREPARHARFSCAAVADAITHASPDLRVDVASVDRGAAAILGLPEAVSRAEAIDVVKQIVRTAIEQLAPDGSVTGAVSAVCRSAAEYATAFEQLRQISRGISTFACKGEIHVLAVDDLGAGRLLLAAADRSEADRFVQDTLGPLLEQSANGAHDLFLTLQTFITNSRSVRRAADALNVHENTVRYRLSRIAEISGLDVATSDDDQLAVQLALLILRLEGRLPRPDRGAVVGLHSADAAGVVADTR
jgi:sugar diacid utilization regulator